MGVGVLILGLTGVFAGIFLLFTAVGVLTGERAGTRRSLSAIEALTTAPHTMRKELHRPFADRAVAPVLDLTVRLGNRLTPQGRQERLQSRLIAAGSPTGWDIARVVSVKTLGLSLGVLLGLLIWGLLGLPAPWLSMAAGLGLLGWFAADAVLYQIGYNRADQIRRDLPDAIDLLTISVEAGLSFDAAVKQVATQTTGPVAQEFARLLAEMQVGRSRSDAIAAMGDRADVDGLRSFASAMVQADTFGVPIAKVLRVQSRELRAKRRQRAEEKAQKVPVKLLFPLIFLILPCIFIIVLGPAVLTLMDNFSTTQL